MQPEEEEKINFVKRLEELKEKSKKKEKISPPIEMLEKNKEKLEKETLTGKEFLKT